MKRNKLKRLWIIIAAFALFFVFVEAALWDGLSVKYYTEITDKVSETIRLAVITDLHDTLYGENQSELVSAVEAQEPDAILFVGDITYGTASDSGAALLLNAIRGKYPCYYVSGNHEYWTGNCVAIKERMRSYDVTVLEGEGETTKINGQTIYLAGVDDPVMSVPPGTWEDGTYKDWLAQLNRCKNKDANIYSVLLSHRPELVRFYENSDFDLVVSGHAHGGQARIPFIVNGLYSPNQGKFPKFAGGRYELNDTVMIVSRGLCINNLPRVFNRPELVIVDIAPDAKG